MIQGKPTISAGNTKIGRIANLNLPPPVTCADLPCLKEGCYAMKSYSRWPSNQKSWHNNYDAFQANPSAFFEHIILTIQRKRNPIHYFRWHSAGEIPNQNYVAGMIRVALAFPHIKFLAFTKRYNYDFTGCPSNLQIVFSSWPGLRIPKKVLENHFVAWMNDGTQDRRIKEHKQPSKDCAGSCVKCKACWNLDKLGRDVVFHKH